MTTHRASQNRRQRRRRNAITAAVAAAAAAAAGSRTRRWNTGTPTPSCTASRPSSSGPAETASAMRVVCGGVWVLHAAAARRVYAEEPCGPARRTSSSSIGCGERGDASGSSRQANGSSQEPSALMMRPATAGSPLVHRELASRPPAHAISAHLVLAPPRRSAGALGVGPAACAAEMCRAYDTNHVECRGRARGGAHAACAPRTASAKKTQRPSGSVRRDKALRRQQHLLKVDHAEACGRLGVGESSIVTRHDDRRAIHLPRRRPARDLRDDNGDCGDRNSDACHGCRLWAK